MKKAMKGKVVARLSTLRLISAAIKDRDIAVRTEGITNGVDEGEILKILGKMIRQRQESARTYEEAGRFDLAERELSEISVIEDFLPRQLDDDEIKSEISNAIKEMDATSIRDMGRVMTLLKKKFTGQVDFGKVGPLVKEKLSPM
tara:strand:+ start:515 stop:949 length:435 start_codon:yes stop_codon:yes gene_type:complete